MKYSKIYKRIKQGYVIALGTGESFRIEVIRWKAKKL